MVVVIRLSFQRKTNEQDTIDDKAFMWVLPNGHVIRSFRPKDGDIYWMPMPNMPEGCYAANQEGTKDS